MTSTDIGLIREIDRVVLAGRVLDPDDLLNEAHLEAARHQPGG